MAKKGYRHKTIAFKVDDSDDMELYNELQKIPYGKFSEQTKEYWRKQVSIYKAVRRDRKENSDDK